MQQKRESDWTQMILHLKRNNENIFLILQGYLIVNRAFNSSPTAIE